MIILLSTRAPLSRSSVAIAAPIPTPTAATPTLLTAPNPNPLPFAGAPNQQLLSGQYNTNFYALWNYQTMVSNALNGCTFAPGAAVTGVTPSYPISASVAACNPGYGTVLSLSLAHGDYDDVANAQTITGPKTFASGTALSGLYNTIGNTGSGAGVLSVPGTGILYLNLSSGGPVAIGNGAGGATGTQFSTNGTATIAGLLSVPGGIAATGIINAQNYVAHGSYNTYPWDGAANSPNNHIEHWTAGTNASHAFSAAFSSATSFQCTFTARNNYTAVTAQTFAAASVYVTSSGAAINYDGVCIGY